VPVFFQGYLKTATARSQLRKRAAITKYRGRRLFVRFVPSFFADESGQIAAVGCFAFECVAGTFFTFESDAFENFGGNVLFGFDIIKIVLHFFLRLC
jgi:hypothetical protein